MATDPTEPIRRKAGQYAGVDQGMACTQSSFKVGNNAFLYIGQQGGRCKAMFKLSSSMSEATKLAEEQPDDYQVGNTAWVTARFCSDHPMPKVLWQKWLEESYQLCLSASSSKRSVAKKGGSAAKPPRKSK